ncbi:MAG: hypothetical protein NT018_09460 [Armatimonadetes bacterium]|nr:hypothetical protein [Armatimonadota bacterium]
MQKRILVNFLAIATFAVLALPASAGRATFSHKSMMRMIKACKASVVSTTPAPVKVQAEKSK